jgi:hypothetical protein
LEEAQQREFDRLMATEKYQGVRAMNLTYFEKGELQGQRKLLLLQLEERFGVLPEAVRERVQQMNPEHLANLGKAVLRAQSFQELGLES